MSIHYVHISNCCKVYFDSVCSYRTCHVCCKVYQHIFICREDMVWVYVQFVTKVNKTFLTRRICFLGTNCKRGGHVSL